MVNRLIQAGYVECFNPRSRDKYYLPTKKPFKADTLYKLPTSKSQRLHGVCNVIQIQCSSFKAKTLHPPLVDVKWDKEWDLNNGVHYQQYGYPFSNLGLVQFQRISSPGSDMVKIILPRLTWDNKSGDPNGFLLQKAVECASFFKHHFKIDFGVLEKCQRPDFAIPLTDPKLVELAQRGTYQCGSISIDSSSPDNLPEIESKDYGIVEGLSTIVPRVRRLEERMVGVEDGISRLLLKMDDVLNVFNQPNRPDRGVDVGEV